MKRVAVLFVVLALAGSSILAQDKAAKSDSTKQGTQKMGCQMDCCCRKECKKDKTQMRKDCPKSNKEDVKK